MYSKQTPLKKCSEKLVVPWEKYIFVWKRCLKKCRTCGDTKKEETE